MNILKQATSVDVAVGPFLDNADGNTVEDSLTITQPDVRLKKNGGAWAQKAAAQTLSHEENGWYEVTLDATDTNTVGILIVAIHESGALPVWREFQVVEETIYDALFGASATGALPVSSGGFPVGGFAAGAITAAAVATDAIDADALAADAVAEINATVDTALADYDAPTNAEMVARTLAAASYATATALQTVDDEIATIDGNVDAVLADTNELQGDWVNGGRLDLILDARASQTSVDDLPTNSELATALGTADDAVLAAVAALNDLSAAQVNAEVDAAIETYHLDHLLAATYDPAAKPGAADALLNEIVESDVGVARFTANALEQAPTGGSAPTVGEIADAVWDELKAGHTTPDSFGDYLDDEITSRGTGTALDAAGVRTAVGLTSANLDTQLADIPTNAELATALATADDAVLAAIAALNNLSSPQVGDAVLDEVVEGGHTLRELTRLFAAALVGKVSGAADNAPVFRDIDDSKNRITATTDVDGNRTAITLDEA